MDQLKSNSDEESSHSVPIYRQNGTLTPADGWSGAGWLRSTPLMACPVPPFPNLSVPSPVPPMELSRLQCSSIPTNDGKNPKCLVGRRGTITVLMEKEVMVEITDDRNIRLLRLGRFALTSCSDPRRAALHHPKAQVYQDQLGCVYIRTADHHCLRVSVDGTMALWNPVNPTVSWNLTSFQLEIRQTLLPEICPEDVSLRALHSNDNQRTEVQKAEICHSQVESARHFRCGLSGSIFVFIHGFTIHQTPDGYVEVLDPNRKLTAHPTSGTVELLYGPFGEISLDSNGYIEAKFGAKRLHISSSGLLLSNGYKTAVFDANLSLLNHT